MITLTREEAQQVLDALIKTNAEWKHLADSGDAGNWAAEDQDHYQQCDTAIETLRARLSAPEPEPVAWMHDQKVGFNVPLYTAPPQREWQGLTDEEIKSLLWETRVDNLTFARVIEKVLREKNAA